MTSRAKRLAAALAGAVGLRVQRRRRRAELESRWGYQRRLVDFGIRKGERVLDVGCGNDPFPLATHLVDLRREGSADRHEPLRRHAQPLAVADVSRLPFCDRAFGFAYCSHVLEHVDDPIAACRELMRVASGGYIETPAAMKDALFAWAEGMHRWHVSAVAGRLLFVEYDARQLQGVRTASWREDVLGPWSTPMASLFDENQDLFNVMFRWRGAFAVHVFRLDGSVASHEPASSGTMDGRA